MRKTPTPSHLSSVYPTQALLDAAQEQLLIVEGQRDKAIAERDFAREELKTCRAANDRLHEQVTVAWNKVGDLQQPRTIRQMAGALWWRIVAGG